MGQIKNRQCPSCGGSMIGDSEKQILAEGCLMNYYAAGYGA